MTRGPGYLNTGSGIDGETPIVTGIEIAVPYPTDPAGPVPPDLRWVVLTNASPFTLLIKQGGILGWLAAFTSDVFYAPASNGSLPMTFLAIDPATPVQPGFNSQLFSVWYESDPGGIYPANVGAGEVKLATNTTLFDGFIVNASLPSTTTVDVTGFPGVSIFVRDLSAPNTVSIHVQVIWENASGFLVGAEDYILGSNMTMAVRRPVGGVLCSVVVDGVTGGPIQWQLTITGLIHATPGWGGDIGGAHGEGIFLNSTVNVGAGATATIDASTWLYAGPVTFNFATGLATFVWTVDAIDAFGAFQTIASFQAGDFGAGVQRPDIMLNVPAAQIRVRGQNTTGGAANMAVRAVADMFR